MTAATIIVAVLLASGVTYAAPNARLAGSVVAASDAISFSAGDAHACAVLSDGRVQCWGNNGYGALGDGTEVNRWTPVDVSGITTATQVSGGYSHTCARMSDGTARCWGWNLDGQLGNGSQTTQLTPVLVSGITTAIQVATGRYHSCALLSDGSVRCWGDNGSGQLGDGTTSDRWTPAAVSGIATATHISVGNGHSCARLSDSTLRCWGGNGYGQLGNGTTAGSLTPVTVTGITTATQVSAGSGHTCAPLSTGVLKCWGDNSFRQLGDGTTTNRSTPVSVSGIATATQAAGGEFHSCSRLSDGVVKCWGYNGEGQLGDGTRTTRPTPVPVSGLTTAAEVTAGIQFSCAKLTDGTLKCWGWDVEGNLGDGTMTYQYTPTAVSGITTATQVANGGLHSCARLSDGTARCWGVNFVGTLGDGTTTDRTTPVAVSGITTAAEVDAGSEHSCARLSDATVQCWGGNAAGKLGDGTTTNRLTPVAVSGITTATQISVGSDHSCARLSDGTLRCWGSNGNGRLGDGTTTNRSTPVAVSGITTATQVASGGSHSCARLSDGTVKCWGWNFYGQLGDGTQTDRWTPVAVSGITTATHVVTGDLHSCAVLANGTARCWGNNNSFQFGDGGSGTGIPSGITTATQLAAALDHSCARLSDSTVKCWGLNYEGQIGDGSFAIRSTPVAVSGITTATQVSTGSHASALNGSHSCAVLSDGTIKCWGAAYSGQLGNGVVGYSLVPVSVAIGGSPPPPPPPNITTTSLPGGTVSQAYSQSVTATSGTTPYSWTISAGSLPPGLSLSPTGTPSATISGTPTTSGTYNFTVRVTDSASATDAQPLSIIVAPAPLTPNPTPLDNFNRPPENPVSQGGKWASTGINGGPGAALSNYRLRNFPQPAGGYSYRVSPYVGGYMEAAVTILTRPSSNHTVSVFICLQDAGTTGWDGYELRAKVTSGPDLWEVRRADDGVPTVIASTNFEIAAGGTMLLRRYGLVLQFWWKPPGASWAQKLVGAPGLVDPVYQWGKIGVGGLSSGALDDFGGGSPLTLLQQYAPELRFTNNETYRADSAAIATDLHWPHPNDEHTNFLDRPGVGHVAAADHDSVIPLDDLSLDYLSASAQTGDLLNQPNWSGDAIFSARTDYLAWIDQNPSYRDLAYARVVPGPFGWTFLQYWVFYYYNPKQWGPGFGIWGNHEGDWEWVQIGLDSANQPMGVAISQHGDGEQCDYSTLVEKTSTGRPIVYVAHESHANYFWAGPHDVEWNQLHDLDITRNDGPEYRQIPNLMDFSANPPHWIQDWDGRWGASDGSPDTPGIQLAWDDPWGWQTQQARACTDRPYPPLLLHRASTERRNVSQPDRMAVSTRGRPALPRISSARIVSGTRYGKALRVAYCFLSLPLDPWRRPRRFHLTVENLADDLPPLSHGWKVTKRCATVTHPVGPIQPPYLLRYETESTRGTRSKEGKLRIRGT